MATITSLQFNLNSSWDGKGVREASRDLKKLQAEMAAMRDARVRVSVEADNASIRETTAQLRALARAQRAAIRAEAENVAPTEATLNRVARNRTSTIHADVNQGSTTRANAVLNHTGRDRHVSLIAEIKGTAAITAMRMAMQGLTMGIFVLVAALALIGPASALAGSLLYAGLGIGIIAVAAIVLRENEQIKSSFNSLKESMHVFKDAAQPMVGPLVGAMDSINAAIHRLKPSWESMFLHAAPMVQPLTDGLIGLGENAMPGVISALKAGQPVAEGFRNGMSNLGTSVSNTFTSLAGKAPAFGRSLDIALTGTGTILETLGRGMNNLAERGADAMQGLVNGVNMAVDGLMTHGAPAMMTVMERMGNSFQVVRLPLGDLIKSLADMLGPAIESIRGPATDFAAAFITDFAGVIRMVTPLVQWLAERLGNLFNILRPFTPVLAALVAGFVAYKVVMHALAAAKRAYLAVMAIWHGLVTAWTAVQWALNLAMIANPIGLIVVGIVAFIAIIVVVIGKLVGFRDMWDAVWGFIKTVFGAVWNFLKQHWDMIILLFGPIGWLVSLAANWNTIWNGIKAVFQFVVDAVRFAWDMLWQGINALWTFWSGLIGTAWNTFWATIRGVFDAIVAAIRTAWDFLWNAINHIITFWRDVIIGIWNAMWNFIKDVALGIWNWIKDRWNDFTNGIRITLEFWRDLISNIWNTMWNWIKDVALGIWNWIKDRWNDFTNGIRITLEFWRDLLQGIWDKMWNFIKDVALGIWNWIKDRWNDFTTGVRITLEFWRDTITGIWDRLWSWFRDFVQGIWDGIKNAFNTFKDNVIGTVQGIVDKVKEIWNTLTGIFEAPVKAVKGIWNGVAGALGLPQMAIGGEVQHKAMGGAIYGPGGGTADRVPTMLSNGEHVWTAAEVKAAGGHDAMYRMRSEVKANGYAGGGAVEWMIGQARVLEPALQVTSSYRNTNDYHGQGKAVDLSNGSDSTPQMRGFAQTVAQRWGRDTLELIHSPFGNNIKDGRNVGDGFGFYGAGTMNGHRNHVHWAVPGPLGDSVGPPIGGAVGGVGGPTKEQTDGFIKIIRHLEGYVNHGKNESGAYRHLSFNPILGDFEKDRDMGAMSKRILDSYHKFNNQNWTNIFSAAKNPHGHYGPGGDTPGTGMLKSGFKGMMDAHKKYEGIIEAAKAAGLGGYGQGWQFYVDEIKGAAKDRALERRAAKIAVATALVESNLKMYANRAVPESFNYPHDAVGSDHDSIGLFQQRQAGWGTVAQRMNPRASAGMFYNALIGLGNWRGMGDGQAAQAVQRSAFPSRYDQRMGEADRLVGAYATGTSNAPAGWSLVGENGPEAVKFRGGEQIRTFDEIIDKLEAAATEEGKELATRLETELRKMVDRLVAENRQQAQVIGGKIEDCFEAWLAQQGIKIDINGGQDPQAIINQLVPQLEMMLRQKVGMR